MKSVSRRVFREMRVTSSISGCDPTKTGYLAGMHNIQMIVAFYK
ncbi:hypothetical protein BAZSYMA_ACONTIG61346_2 [Bathymodiolus azoricus thioautotrophic gill symbiont]|uniref:Uncharacterized protein n=1 Tax=Bathymodiolus azoricus thioautotrophic gill symbiont TaxID=235205 RepID=A0A1H6LF88_9GAMM|nr:hypothetical protein BAZSYMA_ACONTIG61346_2 [Bathymodiolus azoricus thioautotrophic gill symbiont]